MPRWHSRRTRKMAGRSQETNAMTDGPGYTSCYSEALRSEGGCDTSIPHVVREFGVVFGRQGWMRTRPVQICLSHQRSIDLRHASTCFDIPTLRNCESERRSCPFFCRSPRPQASHPDDGRTAKHHSTPAPNSEAKYMIAFTKCGDYLEDI